MEHAKPLCGQQKLNIPRIQPSVSIPHFRPQDPTREISNLRNNSAKLCIIYVRVVFYKKENIVWILSRGTSRAKVYNCIKITMFFRRKKKKKKKKGGTRVNYISKYRKHFPRNSGFYPSCIIQKAE